MTVVAQLTELATVEEDDTKSVISVSVTGATPVEDSVTLHACSEGTYLHKLY